MKTSPLLILITLLLLAGCSVIKSTSSPSIDIYTLSPMLEENDNKVKEGVILALFPIRSSRALMGTNIIYRENNISYDSYAYSRWSDSPAKLLEFLLQQNLTNNKLILAVISVDSVIKPDVILEGTLLDFSHYIQEKGLSTGRVTVQFNLINARNKSVLATKEFSAEVIAEPKNAKGAADAINQAAQEVTLKLNNWLTKQLSSFVKK